MSTPGALAGLETFDVLNIDYERAYLDNPFKTACISKAISLLPPGSRVLDVGCGTGLPVAAMLSEAGLSVVGCDISPKMIALAHSRVPGGSFSVSDMLAYEPPEGGFAAVFLIFSHLQLLYADVHAVLYKYACALLPEGILVVGQMPIDKYVTGRVGYDPTRTYVEDYPAPFMGEMIPSFAMSEEGQLRFLRSMGLEIVSNTVDTFQPKNDKCLPEEQQYVIARRPDGKPLALPQPLPKPAA